MTTNNLITTALLSKLEEINSSGTVSVEAQRNAIKEELQFYVLNFIYHHPKYSNWIMYGGSALRICHKLNRMSVDLDFEIDHEINENFLKELKKEILKYFKDKYGLDSDFLTISITRNRGLLLKFHLGDHLGINYDSKQIHVKIDLNHFSPKKVVTELHTINHAMLSFSIKTYNMSSLMASKVAAVLLRNERGVGKDIFNEKGRDIYDLIWYMEKQVLPDLDYLKAKEIDESNPRSLFDKITIKMNSVSPENLRQDLTPLFFDQSYIENWLRTWHNNYLNLLRSYNMNKVENLEQVRIFEDFNSDVFSFSFHYTSDEGRRVRIICKISDYWVDFGDGDLNIPVDSNIRDISEFSANGVSSSPAPKEKLLQYASLFSKKVNRYIKKTGGIIIGDVIMTKVIRMTADNLNQAEQIVLNKSALISCELEDLLK